jgi:hypothetical protein
MTRARVSSKPSESAAVRTPARGARVLLAALHERMLHRGLDVLLRAADLVARDPRAARGFAVAALVSATRGKWRKLRRFLRLDLRLRREDLLQAFGGPK